MISKDKIKCFSELVSLKSDLENDMLHCGVLGVWLFVLFGGGIDVLCC